MPDNPKKGDATVSGAMDGKYSPADLEDAETDPTKIATTSMAVRGLLQKFKDAQNASDYILVEEQRRPAYERPADEVAQARLHLENFAGTLDQIHRTNNNLNVQLMGGSTSSADVDLTAAGAGQLASGATETFQVFAPTGAEELVMVFDGADDYSVDLAWYDAAGVSVVAVEENVVENISGSQEVHRHETSMPSELVEVRITNDSGGPIDLTGAIRAYK